MEQKQRAPRSILGSDGTLYVPALDAMDPADLPKVSGRVPDGRPAQLLRVDLSDGDGQVSQLFVPVGASFIAFNPDAPSDGRDAPADGLAFQVRESGDVRSLPATERTAVWADSRPLDVVLANPPRRRASTAAPGREAAAQPAGQGSSGQPIDLWGGGPEPSEEDLRDDPEAPHDWHEAATTQEADPEPEVEVHPASWRPADTGPFPSLETWRLRSPRGELWMSELLTVLVDHPDELDRLSCLVPIRDAPARLLADQLRPLHARGGRPGRARGPACGCACVRDRGPHLFRTTGGQWDPGRRPPRRGGSLGERAEGDRRLLRPLRRQRRGRPRPVRARVRARPLPAQADDTQSLSQPRACWL